MTARQIQKVKLPTTVGCGALAMWSIYALVVSELVGRLPLFQTLFMMFSFSFIIMALRLTASGGWQLPKQPWFIWLIGILGVCGSDTAYLTAMQYAPPAHVDLIDCLWPVLVILLSSVLPQERLALQHIVAGILGFLGVFLLITSEEGLGVSDAYLPGYLFAFTAPVIWSIYTIVARWYQKMSTGMVNLYCGIGALIFLILHFRFETWAVPTTLEFSLVLLLGLASGAGSILWTYAMQKGNLRLLTVLAYFTPVISMTCLVLSGKEVFSPALISACLLIVSGVVIQEIDWERVRAWIWPVKAEA